MTDSEEQNDELLALSEILERTDFLCSISEEGLNTGLMSVTVNLVEESGLQVGDYSGIAVLDIGQVITL